MKPNQAQFMSLVRAALTIVGTLLVSYKMFGVTDAIWQPIAGGLLLIAPIMYGLWTHTDANAVATVAAMPSTEVTDNGRSIILLKPELVQAAKANATPATVT